VAFAGFGAREGDEMSSGSREVLDLQDAFVVESAKLRDGLPLDAIRSSLAPRG
jgi:hypothetical protein